MICGRCFKQIEEEEYPYATVRVDAIFRHAAGPHSFEGKAMTCYLCANCMAETSVLLWGTAQQRDKMTGGAP